MATDVGINNIFIIDDIIDNNCGFEATNESENRIEEQSCNEHIRERIILQLACYVNDKYHVLEFMDIIRDNRDAFSDFEQRIMCGGVANAIIGLQITDLVRLCELLKVPIIRINCKNESNSIINNINDNSGGLLFNLYVTRAENDEFFTTKTECGKILKKVRETKRMTYFQELKWNNSENSENDGKNSRNSRKHNGVSGESRRKTENIVEISRIPIISNYTTNFGYNNKVINKKLFIGSGDFRFEALYSMYLKPVKEIIIATELSSKNECINKYSEYNMESNINTIKAKSGMIHFNFDARYINKYFSYNNDNSMIKFEEIVSVFPYVDASNKSNEISGNKADKSKHNRNSIIENTILLENIMKSVTNSLTNDGHFVLIIREKDPNFNKIFREKLFHKYFGKDCHKQATFDLKQWMELGYYHKKTHENSSAVDDTGNVMIHCFCKSQMCQCLGYNTLLKNIRK